MDKYYDTKNGYQKNNYQYRNNPGLEDTPDYGKSQIIIIIIEKK